MMYNGKEIYNWNDIVGEIPDVAFKLIENVSPEIGKVYDQYKPRIAVYSEGAMVFIVELVFAGSIYLLDSVDTSIFKESVLEICDEIDDVKTMIDGVLDSEKDLSLMVKLMKDRDALRSESLKYQNTFFSGHILGVPRKDVEEKLRQVMIEMKKEKDVMAVSLEINEKQII